MIEHTIPCETYVRLAKLLDYDPMGDPWCKSVRLEDGYAIVTNRQMMVVERIDCPNPAPFHLVIDPVLLQAAETEAPMHSKLHITAIDAIKTASAKTTLGYSFTGNAGLYLDEMNVIDSWRERVPTEIVAASNGSMRLCLKSMQSLLATSPSGAVTFPEIVDWAKPVVVNDEVDPNWFAVFFVRRGENPHNPARLPAWFKGVGA